MVSGVVQRLAFASDGVVVVPVEHDQHLPEVGCLRLVPRGEPVGDGRPCAAPMPAQAVLRAHSVPLAAERDHGSLLSVDCEAAGAPSKPLGVTGGAVLLLAVP